MGKELLTEDSNVNDGDSSLEESPFLLAKVLDDAFPYYLSLGMSYEEYWDGDPSLVIAYRKAEDMKAHRRNWEMWMNGRYVYDAIMRMLPSMQLWRPKPPLDYMTEPYPLTRKEYEERIQKEEKRKQEEIRDKMLAFASAYKSKNAKVGEKKNE